MALAAPPQRGHLRQPRTAPARPRSARLAIVTSPAQRRASVRAIVSPRPVPPRRAPPGAAAVEALEHRLLLVRLDARAPRRAPRSSRRPRAAPPSTPRAHSAARSRPARPARGRRPRAPPRRSPRLAAPPAPRGVPARGRAAPSGGARAAAARGEVDRLGRRVRLAGAREHEQLVDELAMRSISRSPARQLARRLRRDAGRRRLLEAQPQPRERRAQLVRGVRDERLLAAEHVADAIGHVVERACERALLGRALERDARVEVAARHARRRRAHVADRAHELARDQAAGERGRAPARSCRRAAGRRSCAARRAATAATLCVIRTAPTTGRRACRSSTGAAVARMFWPSVWLPR